MNVIEGIVKDITKILDRLGKLETKNQPRWVFSQDYYGSTNWDGDLHSTTGKTLIDLAEFGIPAGVKAILVRLIAWDSGSAGAGSCWFGISPNNTAAHLAMAVRMDNRSPNNTPCEDSGICPCDPNGDIYYQITASGANTMACHIMIWGYLI